MKENKIESSRFRYKLWTGFVVATLAYTVAYFIRENIVSAVASQQWGGSSNFFLYGSWIGAIAIGYSIGKWVLGNASDRLKANWVLGWALILTSLIDVLNMILIEFSLWKVALITFFVLGFLQGACWPPIAKFFSYWFVKENRATFSAIWSSSHNLGSGLLPFIVILSNSLFFGWASKVASAILPASMGIVFGIISLFWFVDTPESVGLSSPIDLGVVREKMVVSRGAVKNMEFEVVKKWYHQYWNDFVHIFHEPAVLWLSLSQVMTALIRFIPTVWLLLFLRDKFGWELKDSGWIYFFYQTLAIPGTIIGGVLSDYLVRSRLPVVGGLERSRLLLVVSFLMLIPILMFVVWFKSLYVIIASILLIGFLIFVPYHLLGMIGIELVRKESAGNVTGFMGFSSYFLVGVFNIITGILLEKFGYNVLSWLYITYWILIIISNFFLFRREKKVRSLLIN